MNTPLFISGQFTQMPGINRFYHSALQSALEQHNLASFDALWNMERNWVEQPNKRRQGWSGVCRFELPDTDLPAIFIKRQENHNTRTVMHPFAGVPTYRRELESIERFQKYEIPTISPVYYGERKVNGDHQATLITIALDGYRDIDSISKDYDDRLMIPILGQLARIVRKMHDRGLAHYCLYPSHSFAQVNGDNVDIKLIDLEKARFDIIESRRRFKDLECFLRHTKRYSIEARKHFLDSYLKVSRLSGADTLRKKLEHLIFMKQEQG